MRGLTCVTCPPFLALLPYAKNIAQATGVFSSPCELLCERAAGVFAKGASIQVFPQLRFQAALPRGPETRSETMKAARAGMGRGGRVAIACIIFLEYIVLAQRTGRSWIRVPGLASGLVRSYVGVDTTTWVTPTTK